MALSYIPLTTCRQHEGARGAHIKLLDEDEEVDFGGQAGDGGHAGQEALRWGQLLQAAPVRLEQLQLVLLWRYLRTSTSIPSDSAKTGIQHIKVGSDWWSARQ